MKKPTACPRLTKPMKERKDALERLGCQVISWRMGRSTHVKFQVRLPNGDVRMVVCPSSPSDCRGLKNMEALIKRWVAEPQPA